MATRVKTTRRLIVGAWPGQCRDLDVDANVVLAGQAIDRAADAGCDFLWLAETFPTNAGAVEQVRAAAN